MKGRPNLQLVVGVLTEVLAYDDLMIGIDTDFPIVGELPVWRLEF
nr:hypothetical protein [Methylomarinum sp. Ch1-1]MDP4520627.1 hypothetical protein [Methylomarinum sp. Ch1-1]